MIRLRFSLLVSCILLVAAGWVRPASSQQVESPSQVVPLSAFRDSGHWIERGLRIEAQGDKIQVAQGAFPAGGQPRGLRLPPHLGGGVLFYQSTGSDGSAGTDIYRANEWTSALTPLARIPFAVRLIVPGFDRVYLIGTSLKIALDLKSGEALSLAPLPPLTTIEGLAFDGPERALVAAPLVGVLYTKDSGMSWRGISGAESLLLSASTKGLYVRTKAGVRRVDANGQLVEDPRPPLVKTWEGLLAESLGTSISHRSPAQGRGTNAEQNLVALVTRGVSSKGVFAALDKGKLITLKKGDGFNLRVTSVQSEEGARCLPAEAAPQQKNTNGEETNKELLFICQGKRSEVFALSTKRLLALVTSPHSSAKGMLRSLFRSNRPRKLLARGGGAILLNGPCKKASSSPTTNTSFSCLVSAGKTLSIEIKSPGKKRATSWEKTSLSLSKTALWSFWIERKKKEIHAVQLWHQESSGAKENHRVWHSTEDSELLKFLETGSLLPRATPTPDGFSLWATQGRHFVGLLLSEDPQPSFFAVQRPLGRAIFDGPRALLWGAAGFAKLSQDGGRSFHEIDIPYTSGDLAPAAVVSQARALQMGCSGAGCLLGNLARLGWNSEAKASLPKAPRATLPTLGPGRFVFDCGQITSSSARRNHTEATSLPRFWDLAPPNPKSGDEAFSIALPFDLGRLYAWGPDGRAWAREGVVEFRFVDPWDPVQIRRTAPTPRLFSTLLETKNALGTLDLSTAFPKVAFDPSGQGGVLLLRTRSSTEILVFESGETLRHIPGAHKQGLRSLVSTVQVKGTWYAAFQTGSRLRVVRLDSRAPVEIATLSLGEGGLRSASLVRSTEGDLGISIEADLGLLVYPLSTDGKLSDVVLVPHQAVRPKSCSTEASGYIVDRAIGITPYLEGSEESPLNINAVRARWLVGVGKPCLKAMTARTRSEPHVPRHLDRTNALPLSLLNSDSEGRRSRLLCR